MVYELVTGDGGSTLRVTLVDKQSGEPLDLTGKAVHVQWRIDGGALVTRAMTLLDQGTLRGQAEYAFTAADLVLGAGVAAGTMVGQYVLQSGQSDQLTSLETFKLVLRARLA